MEGDGNIHITNLIALVAKEVDGAIKKDCGVDAFEGVVGVGEVLADVAQSNRTEQCIAQCVNSHIAVRVGNAALLGLHLYATNHKGKSLCQGVYIVSKSYAHNLQCFLGTKVVIFAPQAKEK